MKAIIIILLLSIGTCQAQESRTGYFLAAGLPFLAAGFGAVFSAVSMQPTIDYQSRFVEGLDDESTPVEIKRQEGEYLQAMQSKQKSLKTLGYVFISAGAASVIIAIAEHQRTHRKVFIQPQLSPHESKLSLSYSF